MQQMAAFWHEHIQNAVVPVDEEYQSCILCDLQTASEKGHDAKRLLNGLEEPSGRAW